MFLSRKLSQRDSQNRIQRKSFKTKITRVWPPFEREDVFRIRCTLGVFMDAGLKAFQNSQYFRSLSVADVNGDGEPDIVTADEIFDEVSVLLLQ